MHDPEKNPLETPAVGDLQSLMERARQGDQSALPALRLALDARPELWQRFGDLAAHAEAAWIRLSSAADLGMAEALKRKLAALKAELAGPSPSPLERLLIARVGATWLQVNFADAVVAQAAPETSLRQMRHALGRQAQAQRSHLQAIAALATVRRLLPGAREVEPHHEDVLVSGTVVETESSASPNAQNAPSAAPGTVAANGPADRPLVVFDPSRDGENVGNHPAGPRQRRAPAAQ